MELNRAWDCFSAGDGRRQAPQAASRAKDEAVAAAGKAKEALGKKRLQARAQAQAQQVQ
jgi:hypothetical protein